MKCALHPEQEAAGQCVYSGKFYCAEELVEIDGKMIGRENVSKYVAEQKGNSTEKKFTTLDLVLTLFTGGLWLLIWLVRKGR